MAKGRKYDYRVVQDGTGWRAEIIRRVTSRKTTVSSSQADFANEAEARAWAEQALKSFSENLSERNKRRSEKRNLAARKTEARKRENAHLKAQQQKLKVTESDQPAESSSTSPWPKAEAEDTHD